MTKGSIALAGLTVACLVMALIRINGFKFETAILYCVLAFVFTLIFANSELKG